MQLNMKYPNLERSAENYLKLRPGKQYECAYLAKQMDVDTIQMRAALNRLIDAQIIKTAVVCAKRKFFVPGEQKQLAPPPAFTARKPWAMPQAMTDALHRIQTEYRAHPSKTDTSDAGELSAQDRNRLAMIGTTN